MLKLIETILKFAGPLLGWWVDYLSEQDNKKKIKEANNETDGIIARGIRRERIAMLKAKAARSAVDGK